MKCKKCGNKINEFDEFCKNCETPLDEKNGKPFNYKKGKHIDIEEIEARKEEDNFNETKKSVKRFLLFLLLISIIGFIYLVGVLILEISSHKVFEEYDDIMEQSPLAFIYLGKDDEINEMCMEYANNYNFDYLNIQVKNISYAKKKKLRRELNIYNLTSTLVIIKDGVPISHYSKLTSTELLQKELQNDNIIPMIIEDTEPILEAYKKAISNQDDTIIYIPTKYSDDTDEKNAVIKKISEQYGLMYEQIKGYVLSNKQLLKIMSEIGFSVIQDDLILYVSEGKVVTILDAISTSENDYFHLLLNRGIIDITSSDYLSEINRSQFINMVKDKSKNVVFIGTNECNYCDRVRPILGKIASQNNITIYYLDATKDKERISNTIKEIGYEEGLTITPFVLIVENGKYVDSVIGLADKDLYINKFIEFGVIK